jgi:hypothetical protein
MDKKSITSNFGIILVAGSLWGIIEFGAGMGLQKCATLATGAILTGLSLFWLSLVWSFSKRLIPVLIVLVIAMMFKWLDALLLHVAWNHASVLNPMFAFFTTMTGFILLIGLFRKKFFQNRLSRILTGGGAALVAMSLFPLVKFATGNLACTYAATNIPLSVYTAPLAILIGMITVPLGHRVALRIKGEEDPSGHQAVPFLLSRAWSSAIFLGSIIIIVMARII